jgi:hypothetical protein
MQVGMQINNGAQQGADDPSGMQMTQSKKESRPRRNHPNYCTEGSKGFHCRNTARDVRRRPCMLVDWTRDAGSILFAASLLRFKHIRLLDKTDSSSPSIRGIEINAQLAMLARSLHADTPW